jgi:dihydrofolate reductase
MTIMDIAGSSIREGAIEMGKIVVVNNVTLDGVTQGLGRPDEDTRGGFEYGGWGIPYGDQVQGEAMGKSMAQARGILLGRRTYEDFYGYWPKQTDNPYTEVLNQTPKYVASTTATEPLPWQNSTLLSGNLTAKVSALRDRTDGVIAVLGSGELVRWLAQQDLIDEYLMLIHPLVLGSGTRLFPEKGPRRPLRLTEAVVTTTGVVIATYDARAQGR